MIRVFVVSAVLLVAFPAFAQQPQPTNATDRVATQIGRMFMQIEQQNDQISALQAQFEQSRAEVKRLKDKYEPAPVAWPNPAEPEKKD